MLFFLSALGQIASELPEYKSDIDVHNFKEKTFVNLACKTKVALKDLALGMDTLDLVLSIVKRMIWGIPIMSFPNMKILKLKFPL
jgi:hypothetical protein